MTQKVMTRKQNAFVQYFADLWAGIVTTYKGMRVTIGYFFTKPVTMRYPEERPAIPAGHRGVHRYEEEKCNICRACITACPVDCILLEAQGKGKDGLILTYDVDYSKCLFCNLCCEACTQSCLYLGEEYDISTTVREQCVLHFARRKSEAEKAEHQVQLERKEAERKAKAKEKEAAADSAKAKE